VQFLNQLGPIHVAWHQAHNGGTAQTGFLLFHWELIQRFSAVGGPASFGGVKAFTLAELTQFGAAYQVSVTVGHGDANALKNFSASLEQWHNAAHHHIGMHFGIDLMNPATNVKLKQFWQLHSFINAQFLKKLKTYNTPTGGSVQAEVTALESSPNATRV
jgi:hypothetical protein